METEEKPGDTSEKKPPIKQHVRYSGGPATQEINRESLVDAWLLRGSRLAQIVLVFGALAGYVLTVRPIYQKELLTEEIAMKELDLQEMRAEIASFEPLRRSLELEIHDLRDSIAGLSIQEQEARSVLADLRQQLNTTSESLRETKQALTQTEIELNHSRKNIFFDELSRLLMVEGMRRPMGSLEDVNLNDLDSVEPLLFTAYDLLSEVLNRGAIGSYGAATSIPQQALSRWTDDVRSSMELNRTWLSSLNMDISELRETYQERIDSLREKSPRSDEYIVERSMIRLDIWSRIVESHKRSGQDAFEFLEMMRSARASDAQAEP